MGLSISRKSTEMSILKYKVSHSDKYGRYLVAEKDIAAGELIFRDEPTVIGPMDVGKKLHCFGCTRSIFNVQFRCCRCKVAPMCSEICEKYQKFHSNDECELFETNRNVMENDLHRLIDILIHIRLWLIYKTNPKVWAEVNKLESHLKERREKPVWNHVKMFVIKTFEEFNIISPDDKQSNELMQQICGILDVNTFEIRSQTDVNDLKLGGLYLEPSLMAHKCISNTHLTVDDEFQLSVFASVPIQKDEMICFSYTSPFMGYDERQNFLLEGKYFQCICDLCEDPTEKNSHISTILCSKCKQGFVTKEKNPTQISTWKCQSCEKIFNHRLVQSTVEISKNLVAESKENDIKGMENLLKTLSRSLHQNHFVMLNLKQKLLGVYKEELLSNYVETDLLLRTIEIGHELLSVIDIMEPGISRLKGILLYEMHLPMVTLANREYNLQKSTLNELLSKLEEAKVCLKKSLSMLLIEPPMSPEGILARDALQQMKNLNQKIMDVNSMLQN